MNVDMMFASAHHLLLTQASRFSRSLYLSTVSLSPLDGSVSGMNFSSGTHGHNQKISSIMEDEIKVSICFETNMNSITLIDMK